MSRPSYLPTGVYALDVWLRQFISKLPLYAHELKIEDCEIKELEDQLQMHSHLLQYIAWLESELDKQYRFKDSFVEGEICDELQTALISLPRPTPPPAVALGLVKRIAKLVKRIKNMRLYTETIGIDLGIIPPKTNKNAAYSTKPEIVIILDADRPVIKWKKRGVEALDIYVDRGDGLGYVLLGTTSRAKFVDMTPLPKVLTLWTYKAIYKKGNQQVGELSNPCSVAVIDSLASME